LTNRTIGPLPAGLPRMRVITGGAALHEEPSPTGVLETQLLYGEELAIHGEVGDWWDASMAFGEFAHRGFVARAALAAATGPQPTHRVWERWTPLRSIPRLKAVVLERLSLGSLVAVLDEAEDHYKVWPHGWVFKTHVRPLSHREPDFVASIRGFEHTPFVWGGRSSFGMDCSGMIQLALALAGLPAPRAMTDMMEHLGRPVMGTGDTPGRGHRAGDFLFYSGHCGMFVDAEHVINSNGKAGRVQVEPLDALHRRMTEVRGYTFAGTRRLD
jgi:cell wall-associated NlpC family hydrolase